MAVAFRTLIPIFAGVPAEAVDGVTVPPAAVPDFFFDGYDGDQAMSLTRDQAEMLALIRASGITPAELRVLLGLSPQAMQLLVDFVGAAARDQARHREVPGEPAP